MKLTFWFLNKTRLRVWLTYDYKRKLRRIVYYNNYTINNVALVKFINILRNTNTRCTRTLLRSSLSDNNQFFENNNITLKCHYGHERTNGRQCFDYTTLPCSCQFFFVLLTLIQQRGDVIYVFSRQWQTCRDVPAHVGDINIVSAINVVLVMSKKSRRGDSVAVSRC